MSEKDIYIQKMKAQLDEWKADLKKLKAKAEGASGDKKLKLKKQIDAIENELKEGEERLSEFADASEDSWSAIKKNVENAWESLKSKFEEKDLYQQKKQAQLDEWKAELEKLKAQAEGASGDAKLKLKKQIDAIENELKKGEEKLSELADASEDASD